MAESLAPTFRASSTTSPAAISEAALRLQSPSQHPALSCCSVLRARWLASGCGRFIHRGHPALPRASQQRRKLTDRFRVFVLLERLLGIVPAPPAAHYDAVWRGVLVDKNFVRKVTLEAPHIGPHLPPQAQPFRLRTRLQPRIPDDCHGHESVPQICEVDYNRSARIRAWPFHIQVPLGQA